MSQPASDINAQITAVILAGGLGRRMGGKDKGLVEFNNKPLIQHVIDKLLPQVEHIIINANRNTSDYAVFGFPVISDTLNDFQGPLAGFLAGMEIMTTNYMLCVPCDGPSLSNELVNRLAVRLQEENAELAVAHDGNRLQPVYALITADLKASLENYLTAGERKIDRWYARHRMAVVDFSDSPDTFININTQQDKEAQQHRRSTT